MINTRSCRIGGMIITMDNSGDAWEHLLVRLATLRAVGGVPAMRFELYRYDNETLALLEEASIKTVLSCKAEGDEMEAAFEIAASINDVIEHRKGK